MELRRGQLTEIEACAYFICFQEAKSHGEEAMAHLSSATLINPPAPTPSGPSAEDIRKVISDYKSRESKKAEGDKGKEKEKEKEVKVDDSLEPPPEPLVKSPSPKPQPTSSTHVPVAAPAPSHKKYALHRQIFDMRRDEIKRKEMGVKAREVGKGESQVFSLFLNVV